MQKNYIEFGIIFLYELWKNNDFIVILYCLFHYFWSLLIVFRTSKKILWNNYKKGFLVWFPIKSKYQGLEHKISNWKCIIISRSDKLVEILKKYQNIVSYLYSNNLCGLGTRKKIVLHKFVFLIIILLWGYQF